MSQTRIAMWSGPRNLSTAMMYSFAQRADAEVVDEPFYGVYLRRTGIEHPMREKVLAAMPESEDEVIDRLVQGGDAPVFYQKHMTHHMIEGMGMDWLDQVTNVFLIRHPARVIASYGVKREAFDAADLGFTQQFAIYEHLRNQGQMPLVIESDDIRQDPRKMLSTLCEALGIPFDEAMLSWPKGGNKADGAWAPHWYGAVHQSTGFAGPEGPLPAVDPAHQSIYDECLVAFENMRTVKLAP